jgi:hypothetical protein
VGIGAHALDELRGRPLHTRIPKTVLVGLAAVSITVACVIGIVGAATFRPWLVALVPVGLFLVVAYNLELFGGRVHTDVGFAAAWGAFPLLTGYVAQAGRLDVAAVIAAFGAFALSYTQRTLSTPARLIRRHVTRVDGAVSLDDGTVRQLDEGTLLAPLEVALRWLSWAIVALAIALVIARLT